ncbi:MAG: hypothetical protein AAGN35_20895 [Bacteroidota bacterium]
MRSRVHFFLMAVLLATPIFARPGTPGGEQEFITVYVFLHESCRISQNYTRTLRELHAEFASEHLQFIGLFPNLSSEAAGIAAFRTEYEIPFGLETDYCHARKEALGATVTPEVVVYHESREEILYQGRIDDTYFRVGQRRQVTTTSELRDVLESIVAHRPIPVRETQAIGCFIAEQKLSTQDCPE